MDWRKYLGRLPGSRKCLLEWKAWKARRATAKKPADLSVFHDLAPPPTGGGHQFMRALLAEFEKRSIRVEMNSIHPHSKALLINSYNFQPDLLRRLKSRPINTVHRLDGPLQSYRGFDDGTDGRIVALNREFADVSVFQSQFSKDEHRRLGMNVKAGPVILNASNSDIFRKRGERLPGRTVKVIATSWSDNPNKGLEAYQWLDDNLDFTAFDFIFVGNCRANFKNIKHIPPCSSDQVAKYLADSDIYLTASINDPCSNSLTEALTVGLPCVYRKSGGHAEIAGLAGEGFFRYEEIPTLLNKIHNDWLTYHHGIRVPSMDSIADAYISVLKLDQFASTGS